MKAWACLIFLPKLLIRNDQTPVEKRENGEMKLVMEQDGGSIVELKDLVGIDDAANVLI